MHIFVWFDRPVNFEKRYHHLRVEKRFFETQHCHHHGDRFFRFVAGNYYYSFDLHPVWVGYGTRYH